MKRKTRFISVEVEIKTDHPYEEYVRWFTALGEPVEVVSCDTHRSYIYFAPLPCGTPDETIRRLCYQIADLPGPARQVWDAAGVRNFFIGYKLGDEPLSYEDHLSCATLSLVTSLGAGIGLALYATPD
ncbi:MAG: hypothetical protein EOP84_06325 [Verrucomicrobiaceae bacterium]|nr:MAG: hypothetical protein EOP84_06325 [Verrucomicrobiaceae bacterium]